MEKESENNKIKKTKEMVVAFRIINNQIQTQVKTENITPLEAVALLEMVKDQFMDNLRKSRQNVFESIMPNQDKPVDKEYRE